MNGVIRRREDDCRGRFTPLFSGTLAVLSSHGNTLSWCCPSFVNPWGYVQGNATFV